MRTAALLLLAATALAGCNAQPGGSNVAAPENAAVEKPGSLAEAFTDPAATVAKLNQFGYRLGAYENGPNGFTAAGEPVFLSQSDAKNPNRGTVELTGKDGAAIDAIAFALTVTDDVNADTAKKRLTDNVRAFLFQYGVKDGGALDAIAKEQDADGPIGDSPAAIVVEKDKSPRRITVTFQRATATAPAEAAVQTKQP
ncbi:MAG TPA: hypothetical protein VLG14_05805 [Sphingomonas sp.]|nr:hypothetical protein [Sphingomonas sp.]